MILFDNFRGLLYPLVIAAFMGLTSGLITAVFTPVMREILTWLILIIRFLMLMVYLIFWEVFRTAFSFSLVVGGTEGANALTEFSDLVMNAIASNSRSILLFLLPLILFLFFIFFSPKSMKTNPVQMMKWLAAALILIVFFIFSMKADTADPYSPQSLYHSRWVKDLSLRKLGFDVTALSDLKYTLFPSLIPQEEFTVSEVPSFEEQSEADTDKSMDNAGDISEETVICYNSLGKYHIQSREKEQFCKNRTALNVILFNCTKSRTISQYQYGDSIFLF